MTRLEVRNLRPDEIAGYLVAEVGGVAEDGVVRGDGWLVRLVPGEAAAVGRFRVPVLFIEVEGEREAEVAQYLRRRTMRGGG